MLLACFTAPLQSLNSHENRMQLITMGQWAGRFDVIRHEVDALKLERWFLKTLINFEAVGKQKLPIGPFGHDPGWPPRELVEIAFGLKPFISRAGLCFIGALGDSVGIDEERLGYAAWIRDLENRSYVAAGQFWLHGCGFFVCLDPEGMPDIVQIADRRVSLIHRPVAFDFQINGRPSQSLIFQW